MQDRFFRDMDFTDRISSFMGAGEIKDIVPYEFGSD